MHCLKRHKCSFESSHWPLFGILIVTVIAFWPTFTNGFQMEWDDQWMVINSQTVGRLNSYLFLSIFTIPNHGQIAPINQILYTLVYKFFGFNPLPFHAVSLILHSINICLLYYGLCMVMRDCTQISRQRSKQLIYISVILFAIHPIQVESVAWISASKIPLSTLFYFAGSIILMKYLRKNNYWWYACALLMQLFAYLSKEQSVVFPLFATLLFLWYGIRINSKKFWMELIPFYALGLASVVHEVFFVAHYDQYIQGETYAWWQRFVFCLYAIITYFFKWLVPINLNWMYLFPIEIDESMPWWLILYPVLAIFLIYSFWDWLKKPFVLSISVFYLIHLLLVIHITALPRASVVADRYLYVSIISLNFMFAYLITGIDGLMKHKRLLFAIYSLVLCFLIRTTYCRTLDWKDSQTLKNVYSIELETSINRI